MARTITETRNLGPGPTIAGTTRLLDPSPAQRRTRSATIATYLRALDRLDRFLTDKGMPRSWVQSAASTWKPSSWTFKSVAIAGHGLHPVPRLRLFFVVGR